MTSAPEPLESEALKIFQKYRIKPIEKIRVLIQKVYNPLEFLIQRREDVIKEKKNQRMY